MGLDRAVLGGFVRKEFLGGDLLSFWEAIITRGKSDQKNKCEDCKWYLNHWQCANERSDYYKSECSSLFGCECFKRKGDAECQN